MPWKIFGFTFCCSYCRPWYLERHFSICRMLIFPWLLFGELLFSFWIIDVLVWWVLSFFDFLWLAVWSYDVLVGFWFLSFLKCLSSCPLFFLHLFVAGGICVLGLCPNAEMLPVESGGFFFFNSSVWVLLGRVEYSVCWCVYNNFFELVIPYYM